MAGSNPDHSHRAVLRTCIFSSYYPTQPPARKIQLFNSCLVNNLHRHRFPYLSAFKRPLNLGSDRCGTKTEYFNQLFIGCGVYELFVPLCIQCVDRSNMVEFI